MRTMKFILIFLLVGGLFATSLYLFIYHPTIPSASLYTVEIPIKKEIKQEISAAGSLKLKGQIKIGSVIAGRVKAIHVQENDLVAEGQLLVEIDTGLEDTEIREAQGAYERALAEREFQDANYQRQRQLFEGEFISGAALEEALRSYKNGPSGCEGLKSLL